MECEQTRYFLASSEFTSFHKKLALILEPYLNRRWDLADIGCGLALLDFQLAGKVRAITAIDEDPQAIQAVQERIRTESGRGRFDAEKIAPVLADLSDLSEMGDLGDRKWDVVLISFYGDGCHRLDALLSRARYRGVILVHGRRPNGQFDVMAEQAARMTADDVERFLRQRQYRFRKSKVELQFGQPFKTIDDIHDFLQTNAGFNPQIDPEKQTCNMEERIIKTDRYDYPFYLPKNIGVGIFIIIK